MRAALTLLLTASAARPCNGRLLSVDSTRPTAADANPTPLRRRHFAPVAAPSQPSRPAPVAPHRPPIPVNGTAAQITALLVVLGSNWIFYERLVAVLTRGVSAILGTVASWCSSTLMFPPRVCVVKLRGVLATDAEMAAGLAGAMIAPEIAGDPEDDKPKMRGELISLASVEKTLSRAFSTPGCRAVALLIDSPGGSPAQSSLIYHRLKALRRRHPRVKLLAFVEDSAASGGYYVACAADEIVADHNSIVGSVGVISRSFGYVKRMRMKGLERRVYTAGNSKSGVDPYLPVSHQVLAQQRRVLKELHANFIDAVKEGRGERLQPEAAALLWHKTVKHSSWSFSPSKRTIKRLVDDGAGLFDGSIYSGSTAMDLGLVDRLGEIRSDLRRRYGRAVKIMTIEPEPRGLDLVRLLRWLL